MAAIGLLANSHRSEAVALAAETAAWLAADGHAPRDLTGGTPADGLDLIVSLGGDGTMLHSVGLAVPLGIPVLGVNFGHLGYLTVTEPDGLRFALEEFLADRHVLDDRTTVDVTVVGDGSAALSATGLNDVILQRHGSGRVVRVAMAVNGRPFVSYVADSVIVATATGSTAYNLSARGPIASPHARVLIVTPVAPHSLFDRSLVLEPGEQVAFTVAEGGSSELVVDGRTVGTIKEGCEVRATIGRADARLVTFGRRDFQDILRRKFSLGA